MESVAEILFAMRIKGARLWADEGQLRYDAPRGVLTASDFDTLRTRKQEIIGFLSQPSATAGPPLRPRDASAPVPLTLVQLSAFNKNAATGGRSGRVPAMLTRLSGPLVHEALHRALTALVRRHEVLRTSIVVKEGVPMQQVADAREVPMERFDLTHGAQAGREAKAKQLIQQLCVERIDQARDLLFLPCLFVLDELDHVLLLAMDHILFDAPSMDILQRDLCHLYGEAAGQKPAALPPIPVQFPDYAVWQQKARPTRIDVHDAWWEHYLHGAQHLTVFNERRPLPPRISRWRFRFDRTMTSALRAFSQRHQTTLMMSVLTAFVATLARWCRTTDVVVPLPGIGRKVEQLRDTVGPFGTVLHLRVGVGHDVTFLGLLHRVLGEFENAYEHDDSGKLLTRTPVPPFRSNPTFNFSSYRIAATLEPPIDWASASGRQGRAIAATYFPVDIPFRDELTQLQEEPQLLMFETREELVGSFSYRMDRAGLRSLRQFEQCFRSFAQSMVDAPAEPLPRWSTPGSETS